MEALERSDAHSQVTEYSLPSGCCKCVFAKNQVDRFYTDPEIQVALPAPRAGVFREKLLHHIASASSSACWIKSRLAMGRPARQLAQTGRSHELIHGWSVFTSVDLRYQGEV